jgi:hypothetical protein
VQIVQHDRAIGADREERAGAEINVAGVAAENVPRRRQHDVLQHDIGGEKEILVVEQQPRRDQKPDPDRGGQQPEQPGPDPWYR